jgi:hypothetical protein
MLQPSMQTLKHITLFIDVTGTVGDDNDDPLFGIPSAFEDMRTKNIIETVTIKVVVGRHTNWHRGNWGRLDEVLTAPGWFSLKRVSLVAKIELQVRKLPETQFPRLSSSNSVSFDFKISSFQA